MVGFSGICFFSFPFDSEGDSWVNTTICLHRSDIWLSKVVLLDKLSRCETWDKYPKSAVKLTTLDCNTWCTLLEVQSCNIVTSTLSEHITSLSVKHRIVTLDWSNTATLLSLDEHLWILLSSISCENTLTLSSFGIFGGITIVSVMISTSASLTFTTDIACGASPLLYVNNGELPQCHSSGVKDRHATCLSSERERLLCLVPWECCWQERYFPVSLRLLLRMVKLSFPLYSRICSFNWKIKRKLCCQASM